MKTFTKTLMSVTLLLAATGQHTYAATNNKVVRADFKSKVLLLPCVEVKNFPVKSADGFYDVLMKIAGTGDGLNWTVVKVDPAAEGECDNGPSASSTDDLLKSMGMPSVSDLIKNNQIDDDNEAETETDKTPSINDIPTEQSVNNAIK